MDCSIVALDPNHTTFEAEHIIIEKVHVQQWRTREHSFNLVR